MCSSRFVLPPNAACTTIALRSAASVRMSRHGRSRCAPAPPAPVPTARAMSSQIGWPEGASAEWSSDKPQRLGHDLAGRRRPQELAAAAGRGAGPAAQLGRLFERDLAVGVAHADRLHLARVFALGRRQRHAAGHEHHRQLAHRRPGPSSSPAAPCRRSPPPSRRRVSAASGSAAATRSPHRCGRAGCPSSPPCPACGRRTGPSQTPQTGSPPAPQTPAPPPAPAAPPPSARCDSPAPPATHPPARMPPCVLRIRNSLRRSRPGSHPIAASCVSPKRSPLGAASRNSSSSGRLPAGPGAWVCTSYILPIFPSWSLSLSAESLPDLLLPQTSDSAYTLFML